LKGGSAKERGQNAKKKRKTMADKGGYIPFTAGFPPEESPSKKKD